MKKSLGPLNYAIETRDYPEARRLVEAGELPPLPGAVVAALTAAGIKPPPPIDMALTNAISFSAPPEFDQFLLDHGADPAGKIGLALGCKRQQLAVGAAALAKNAACSYGDPVEVVEALLDANAKRAAADQDDDSRRRHDPKQNASLALPNAAANGQVKVVELLLKRGANPKALVYMKGWAEPNPKLITDPDQRAGMKAIAERFRGLRPMVLALAFGHQDIVKLLEARGDSPSPPDAESAGRLGQLCSRDSGYQVGYALTSLSDAAGKDYKALVSQVSAFCMHFSADYHLGFDEGMRTGSAEMLARLKEIQDRQQAQQVQPQPTQPQPAQDEIRAGAG